jgi:hypothetical protein
MLEECTAEEKHFVVRSLLVEGLNAKDTVMCRVVHVMKMAGSSSDDWIY